MCLSLDIPFDALLSFWTITSAILNSYQTICQGNEMSKQTKNGPKSKVHGIPLKQTGSSFTK